ncbi:hypothetical protein [Mesorhizobium sp. STM 4661]|uniref:hypothetical protein n=1 Tax=Mesorhizobium sp. STM 4661 TaxID=1297570 RepID=UPI0003A96C09|nr:hypothetical protein [Mesorhizobium sp. STM 4661]
MPRQPTTYQFDLFSDPHDAETAQMSTMAGAAGRDAPDADKLMVRLILEPRRARRSTGGGAS